ncbi:mCG1036067 [Mus musculus]|nr:mCG1036067 [Mus musculus]
MCLLLPSIQLQPTCSCQIAAQVIYSLTSQLSETAKTGYTSSLSVGNCRLVFS